MEKIALIILNYNGLPYVLDCLKSVQQVKVKNYRLKVVLVDNNSTDRSVEAIQNLKFKIKIIKNKRNLGFAGGNNKAIKWALSNKFDYVLLLNPDTVVEKNFLAPLLKLIQSDQNVGLVAPILKGKEGDQDIFALGASFNPYLGRTKHWHVKTRPLQKQEQELVSGCCLLIKKEVFAKIGLFDERFFLYFEDSDFCLRAKKAGYKIYVEPKSVVWHKTSLSLGGMSWKKIRYNLTSNFLFILKQVKLYCWPLAFSYLFVLGLKMLLGLWWHKKSWPERAILGWHSDFIMGHHLARYQFAQKLINPNDLVLDAACGSGFGSQLLAQKAKKVYGIDRSWQTLLLARFKHKEKNINFIKMDCQQLQFKNNFFDKVISLETLEHLPDSEKFLKEVVRVLKPGGIFIVSTPNVFLSQGEMNPWHLVEYNVAELKDLLKLFFSQIDFYQQKLTGRVKQYQKKHQMAGQTKVKWQKKDTWGLRKLLPRPVKDFIWQVYHKCFLQPKNIKISSQDFPITKGTDRKALIYLAVCQK